MFTNSNYVSAGYTVTSSQEQGSQNPPVRRSKNQNVVPMQILDLVQHSEEDGPLTFGGQDVGMVKVVGQVLVPIAADFNHGWYEKKPAQKTHLKTVSGLFMVLLVF